MTQMEDFISGTSVNLQALIGLRNNAHHQQLKNLKARSNLSGDRFSNIRGRGIEFEATREYQAGDDIRTMAWRLTARSLKPHIKVYREERDCPFWLALDLSPSLFFGTRVSFKSVKMIYEAAKAGWSALLQNERVGALIANKEMPQVFLPKAQEKQYLQILNALVQSSTLQPAYDGSDYLQSLLSNLQRKIRPGHRIFIYSDFFHLDQAIFHKIFELSRRAHVVLNFIYDPFEASAPPPYAYLLTDGKENILFDMKNVEARQQYERQFQEKVTQLQIFSKQNGITFNLFCTDESRKMTL